MEQRTFASQGSFERYGRKSGRELFLDEMQLVVPWSELQGLVEPHYAKAGNGRRPVGLALMLRTYFLQQWFNLSDPGVEDLRLEFCEHQRNPFLAQHMTRGVVHAPAHAPGHRWQTVPPPARRFRVEATSC